VVREIVKLALAAAIIVIAGGLIALFASGYISAFRPGGTAEAPGEHVIGGGGGISGGISVVSTPAPPPSPQPAPGMPETVQMPYGPQPTSPGLPPVLMPTPQAAGEMPGPYLPVIQPSPLPAPPTMRPPQGEKPVFSWPIFPMLPGQGVSMQITNWFLRIIPVLFPGLYPGWTWWT
jgi:hypothetical protein